MNDCFTEGRFSSEKQLDEEQPFLTVSALHSQAISSEAARS
jgi:hypothetical protein